jgi:hypothetical protein
MSHLSFRTNLGHSNLKFRSDPPSEWFWLKFSHNSPLAKGNLRGNEDHVYKEHQWSTSTSFCWWWRDGWSLKHWAFTHNWSGLLPESNLLSSVAKKALSLILPTALMKGLSNCFSAHLLLTTEIFLVPTCHRLPTWSDFVQNQSHSFLIHVQLDCYLLNSQSTIISVTFPHLKSSARFFTSFVIFFLLSWNHLTPHKNLSYSLSFLFHKLAAKLSSNFTKMLCQFSVISFMTISFLQTHKTLYKCNT